LLAKRRNWMLRGPSGPDPFTRAQAHGCLPPAAA